MVIALLLIRINNTIDNRYIDINLDSDDDDDDLDEDEKYEKTFSVMSLPNLFFNLKNKCASILDDSVVAFENTSEANIELLNDRYEFNEELACQVHI